MKTFIKLLAFVVMGSLLGGCASNGNTVGQSNRTSIGQYSSDAMITSKIKAKYLKDLALKSFNVRVKTNHGIVYLRGTLPTKRLYAHAVRVARNTNGVVRVNAMYLTVSPSANAKATAPMTVKPATKPATTQSK